MHKVISAFIAGLVVLILSRAFFSGDGGVITKMQSSTQACLSRSADNTSATVSEN